MTRRHLLRTRLTAFLEEDLGRGDVTSEALISRHRTARARVVAREPGILAGLEEATILCELVAVEARVSDGLADGTAVDEGATLLELQGTVRGILGVERTLLNLLGHMSGVATLTRRAVDAVAGTGARIAATRKTLPGLRGFQKRAVVAGGGDPHRWDLAGAVLIKDNHLEVSVGVAAAVRQARQRASFTRTVEVEVESLEDALEGARAGADILLLDNMDPEAIRAVVTALEEAGLRGGLILEASGGIGLSDLAGYAAAGVDVISMGALTASAPALDLSLELVAG